MKNTPRKTALKMGVIAVAMFGFGYALVPLYDVFCELTGANGKTTRAETGTATAMEIDTSREVTIEFTGSVMGGLPWDFKTPEHKIRVHPGQPTTISYLATNHSADAVVGQAIPSVSPGKAARFFQKTECFCFNEQELQPGETKGMPVTFIVDSALPEEVKTITLSYAFFKSESNSS